MNISAEMLLEACYPLGDKWYQRGVKRTAVRLVMLERRSYKSVAKSIGTGVPVVAGWVDETEERLRAAMESVDGQVQTQRP
jgi:transposase-like protein